MPRKPKKNVHDIFKLIEDLNFFDAEGHILRLSDPIWKKAEYILN